MLLRVEPFATWYYGLLWWSWILFADGAACARRGRSLFAAGGRRGLELAFWSVPYWFLFEAFNLRVQNWYYVGAPEAAWERVLGYAVSFSTVLPALAVTHDLIASFGPGKGAARAAREVQARGIAALEVVGLVLSLLPLAAPRVCFPLLWVGPTLFLLGRDARHPGSLLARLRGGDLGPLGRLLGAGLLCGGIWESANYLARAKWIYTVPYFEDTKLWEMPVAGFLGFPPFAVESYLFIRVLGRFLGSGPLWDLGPVPGAGRSRHGRRGVLAALGALLASVAAGLATDRLTLWSTYPSLERATWIAADVRGRLEGAGARCTEDLVRLARREPESLAALLGTGGREILERARLATLKGIGLEGERLLHEAGVDGVSALAARDPGQLAGDLAAVASRLGVKAPRAAQVRVWCRAARRQASRAAAPAGRLSGPARL